MDKVITHYKFRIVERGYRYIVQEIVTNYVYGERLGAFGWVNTHSEPGLSGYFKASYMTLNGAKKAIQSYKDGLTPEEAEDEVVWEEGEE